MLMKITFFRLIVFSAIVLLAFPLAGQINKRDEQGRRQGPWQGTFPSGRIRYQGQFENDNPTGTFKYFYNDGALRAELTHTLGKDTVPAVYFHRNRQKLAQGQFVTNQREGLWVFFSERGERLSETWYKNGLQHGKTTTYFPNGPIAETVDYVDGEKHGQWIQYFEDGTFRLNALYEKNNLNGQFKLFHENGKPLLTAYYNNNLPHQHWTFYTAEGEVEREIFYQNGLIVEEKIHIEREIEITIPLKPSAGRTEDIFSSPY